MEALSSDTLTATFDDRSDGLVVTLTGELDASTADALRAALGLLEGTAPQRLEFDLVGLTRIDGSGIALLLEVAQRVAVFEIRRPEPSVRRLIEASALGDFVHIV